MVGASHAQARPRFGVGFLPPRARPLEALFDHVAMAAFDCARADRQPRRPRSGVVQMAATFVQVTVGGAPRGFGATGRFQMRRQSPQHGGHFVFQQPSLLSPPPADGILGRHDHGGVRQVFAGVVEVRQAGALRARLFAELRENPPGAIAQAMHVGLRSQAGGPGVVRASDPVKSKEWASAVHHS